MGPIFNIFFLNKVVVDPLNSAWTVLLQLWTVNFVSLKRMNEKKKKKEKKEENAKMKTQTPNPYQHYMWGVRIYLGIVNLLFNPQCVCY